MNLKRNNGVMLELDAVTRRFQGPADGSPVEVLRGVSIAVAAGDSAAVTGPSGCGKSTLLHLMGGLDLPDSGSVHVEGQNLSDLKPTALARLRNMDIGFVFQQHHLLPQCTVLENCLLPTVPSRAGRDPAETTARAKELLVRVGLAGRLHHRPGQLSGGECQRTAVARALVNHPRLLLADEPTGSLDGAAADQLTRLLLELQSEKKLAMVVVTHSKNLARAMRHHYRLNDGLLSAENIHP